MNIHSYAAMKKEAKKISMVTSYDSWSASIIAESPIDMILVGDSVAMVVHGFDSTIHATTEMMALHTAAVRRGAPDHFIVADMPFMSFRKGTQFALEAVRVLMTAGANAVKLEGVRGHEDTVKMIVESGVPVMGHLGLTPQSVHQLGGYKVQGKSDSDAELLLEDAKSLERLGCFSLVLECVPAELGRIVSQELEIPTIGIGAGKDTDGQVLVLQDMLGMKNRFKPKFLKTYLDGAHQVSEALAKYHSEVRDGVFPSKEEQY